MYCAWILTAGQNTCAISGSHSFKVTLYQNQTAWTGLLHNASCIVSENQDSSFCLRPVERPISRTMLWVARPRRNPINEFVLLLCLIQNIPQSSCVASFEGVHPTADVPATPESSPMTVLCSGISLTKYRNRQATIFESNLIMGIDYGKMLRI